MKQSDRSRWKRHERESAKIIGGERQPSNGKRQEDISHPIFAIEQKERKTVPSWWTEAMSQLEHVDPTKIPVLVFIHAPNIKGKKLQRYAILKLEDLAKLLP